MCKKIMRASIVVLLGLIVFHDVLPYPFNNILLMAFVVGAFPVLVCYAFTLCRPSRMGELAMRKNWLTKAQIDHILSCQKVCSYRFGEIAIEGKYLSPAKVRMLLVEQGAIAS